MTTFLQDVRYGLRMFARAPSFTIVAIATLALGIGANTAIFSVVNALVLRPLPYPEPGQLVMVWQDMRARGGPADEWATPGNFIDWKTSGLFSGITAIQGWQPTLTGHGDPEPLVGEQVTSEYFDVLGIHPVLGRSFRAEDDVPNAARVTIISHALWQRRFDGNASAIGRSITLGGEPHEIIGVMPAGFRPGVITSAELWRPRRLNLAAPARGMVVLRTIARLKPDQSLEQTSSSAAIVASRLAAAYPEWNTGVGIRLATLHSQVVGNIQQGLFVLLGAVGFVLLIACANIANLLLARASTRNREIAVRLALGAGRRRLVRQLLTESVLLSGIGGTLGVLLGTWGVQALVAIAPRSTPTAAGINIDGTVLLFSIGLTVATGVLFGIVPAMHAARADVTPALKDGARGTAGRSGHRTRRALIVAEIAIALVLLVGSGLLMRTLVRLQRYDLGFNPDRVLVASVNPPRVKYSTREQLVVFYDRLLERVSQLPGIERAALTSIVPLGGDNDMNIWIEGQPAPRSADERPAVWYRLVSPAYFDAMSIPLKLGRTFASTEPAPVVVVSDAAARRFWNGENPIGRRVRFGERNEDQWFTVVGVVGEVKMRGARGDSRSEIYLLYRQFTEPGTNVVIKAAGRPEALTGALRQAVRDVDPDIPLANAGAMTTIVAESIDEPRFFALLAAVFAGLALALAAVGIYGVIAYAVAQRTSEIGVRMALGAERRHVFALVVGDGLKLTVAGVAAGIAAAAAMSLSIKSLLFGVDPIDPLTFGAMTAALVATSALACALPARRAAKVDPMAALRAE
jgi:putative ABC transport system permease protein